MVTTTNVAQTNTRVRDFHREVEAAKQAVEGIVYVGERIRQGFDGIAADYDNDWPTVDRRLESGDGEGASRKAYGFAYGILKETVIVDGTARMVYNFFVDGAQSRYDEMIASGATNDESLAERVEETLQVMAKIDTEQQEEKPNRLRIVKLSMVAHRMASSIMFTHKKAEQEKLVADRTAYEAAKQERAEAKKARHLDNVERRREENRGRAHGGTSTSSKGGKKK